MWEKRSVRLNMYCCISVVTEIGQTVYGRRWVVAEVIQKEVEVAQRAVRWRGREAVVGWGKMERETGLTG